MVWHGRKRPSRFPRIDRGPCCFLGLAICKPPEGPGSLMLRHPNLRKNADSARVLILHNTTVLDEDHPYVDSDTEILFTADTVERTLTEAGYEVHKLGVGRDPTVLLDGVRDIRPDVVFNLFEGLADHGETEAHVAGILEWLGVPFTGSPHQILCLARSKNMTKHLLQGAGLPTPAFFAVEQLPVPHCAIGWPVIVKPANQDASVGIDQDSVVTSQDQLEERVA